MGDSQFIVRIVLLSMEICRQQSDQTVGIYSRVLHNDVSVNNGLHI
jgi:hypothetical protein